MQPQRPDIQKVVEQARAFEQKVREGQSELAKAVVTGRSADGTVTVLAQGTGRIHAVRVDPAVFDRRDAPALETAIVDAVRAAADSASRLAQQKMGPVEINLY